jgi:hypothetical protein
MIVANSVTRRYVTDRFICFYSNLFGTLPPREDQARQCATPVMNQALKKK